MMERSRRFLRTIFDVFLESTLLTARPPTNAPTTAAAVVAMRTLVLFHDDDDVVLLLIVRCGVCDAKVTGIDAPVLEFLLSM